MHPCTESLDMHSASQPAPNQQTRFAWPGALTSKQPSGGCSAAPSSSAATGSQSAAASGTGAAAGASGCAVVAASSLISVAVGLRAAVMLNLVAMKWPLSEAPAASGAISAAPTAALPASAALLQLMAARSKTAGHGAWALVSASARPAIALLAVARAALAPSARNLAGIALVPAPSLVSLAGLRGTCAPKTCLSGEVRTRVEGQTQAASLPSIGQDKACSCSCWLAAA